MYTIEEGGISVIHTRGLCHECEPCFIIINKELEFILCKKKYFWMEWNMEESYYKLGNLQFSYLKNKKDP